MRKQLIRALSCAALAAVFGIAARAQTAFEDAKGESSVFIKDGGGFAHVNVTDKSIQFGFLRDRGDERPYFGLDLKGKTSGDFASLFKGGTPSSEAEVGLTLGKRFIFAMSDVAVTNRCIERTKEEMLASDLPRLMEESRKELVEKYKKEHTKEVADRLAKELKEVFIKEAIAKGMSPEGARLSAEAVGAQVFQAEAERMVAEKAEAKYKSEEAKPEVEARAREIAGEEAPGVCFQEDPALERRAVDWLSLRVAYNRARYKLLDESAATFAGQIRKQNFDGFSATIAYNTLITLDSLTALRKAKQTRRAARLGDPQAKQAVEKEKPGQSRGSMILGFSTGVRRKNNADKLDSIDVEDQSFSSTSGTKQRRALSRQTVLSGDYKEFTSVPINTDAVWYPGLLQSRIALDFFTRSELAKTERGFVPGVGLFLTKEGKPTKVIGGISFALDHGKGRFGLVGGFHF